jgi:hypothetical protein
MSSMIHDIVVIRLEAGGFDGEDRFVHGLRRDAVRKDRLVDRDKGAREREHVAATAVIRLEMNGRDDLEVVEEALEQRRVGAGPGVDRLVVVADREDVLVVAGQRMDDAILDGIQVLEFVD